MQNAYEAYDHLSELDPLSLDDLLKVHHFMMAGLTQEAGMFRSGNVGVFRGDQLIHAGTPATYVPEVMAQLFHWLKTSRLPLLLTSCIFHYEFEFIHPFSDGNGRTGRLWHSLLLQRWKPFFAWLPVETLIHERQDSYYAALNAANNSGQALFSLCALTMRKRLRLTLFKRLIHEASEPCILQYLNSTKQPVRP